MVTLVKMRRTSNIPKAWLGYITKRLFVSHYRLSHVFITLCLQVHPWQRAVAREMCQCCVVINTLFCSSLWPWGIFVLCLSLTTPTHTQRCPSCARSRAESPRAIARGDFPPITPLRLDTQRKEEYSNSPSVSSHRREVFLTYRWLNLAQRNALLASHSFGCLVNGRSYQLVGSEGCVCRV